jgi:hypothetical protein
MKKIIRSRLMQQIAILTAVYAFSALALSMAG